MGVLQKEPLPHGLLFGSNTQATPPPLELDEEELVDDVVELLVDEALVLLLLLEEDEEPAPLDDELVAPEELVVDDALVLPLLVEAALVPPAPPLPAAAPGLDELPQPASRATDDAKRSAVMSRMNPLLSGR